MSDTKLAPSAPKTTFAHRMYTGDFQFAFLAHRRRWYTISAVLLLISRAIRVGSNALARLVTRIPPVGRWTGGDTAGATNRRGMIVRAGVAVRQPPTGGGAGVATLEWRA